MKNLNESIGLGGGSGMSHYDGSSPDVSQDPTVISTKSALEKANKELKDAQEALDYVLTVEPGKIQEAYNTCLNSNFGYPDKQNSCIAQWVTPRWATRDANAKQLKEKIDLLQKTTIPNATSAYQDALNKAVDAQNKIIDGEVKKLEAKALTDPVAAEQITKLNAQKLENEQALAKQKIEAEKAKNKSSNIKIYVIVGAIALGLAVIAGIWIWLKSRKAV